MSFPSIPDVDPNINLEREDMINLLLASVAFEELGLAHIINAEGEKIQAALNFAETNDDLIEINRSVERTLRSTIKKEMLLQFKLEDISKTTTPEAPEPPVPPNNFQGCSPGFWKNNTGAWEVYEPTTLFKDVFNEVDNLDENLTLEEASGLGGGGINALARHAVAALLNAAHTDVNYPKNVDTVITKTKEAFNSEDAEKIEELKDTFDEYNNLGCPLPAD